MKKLIIFFLLLLAFQSKLLAQPTVGTGGTYSTLEEAFSAINQGNLTGVITLKITSSTLETVPAVLYQSGWNGTSNYTSINIYPDNIYTIEGDYDGPLIDLNGATSLTINGRVNGSGAMGLTITNINAGVYASTIQFTESAANNTVQYCTLKGSGTGPAPSYSGIVYFSTSSAGGGNSNNIIDHNDITSYYDGVTLTRPISVICSSGSAGAENSGNTISNNNFFDFLNRGVASYGINLQANTTAWTISGNSFYETSPFAPSSAVAFNIIFIKNTGTGYNVTGNFIGGNSSSCGGTFTKTSSSNNLFSAITIDVGISALSNIKNNTIKNINWSNSGTAGWTGISVVAGTVDIGASTEGNTIGATTGTGSVTVTAGLSGNNVYGINISSTGTVNCRYNNIGSITVANTVNASNFYGINKASGIGTTTISNNLIGSLSTTNSINAISASLTVAQSVFGINNSGTGLITISSNTISKMVNSTTNANTANIGRMNGISSTSGTTTISNNIIYDLSNANANNASNQSASVCGLALVGTTTKTVSGNIIYNLSNTNSSFTGSVIGMFIIGNTGGPNSVDRNFIHSLSVASGSPTASLYGINISSGATTYSNNIINLGGTTSTTIYGIYETGLANNNNNLYFNSVYIGGSGTSNSSYALYSAGIENIRNFRNNIFANNRSGGSNLHYAAYITVPTTGTITCNYNDYYAYGVGTVLGYYGTNKTVLPIVTGQDVNSLTDNPGFLNPGSTTATDYKINVPLIGVSGTGISADYEAASRVNPTVGAFELPINKWTGTASPNWNEPGSWTVNVPVGNNINLIFADSPGNNCTLVADQTINDITNSQGAYRLVTDGNKLTVTGNINFTNGAQFDASGSGSTIEFAGTAAQSIPSGAFLGNNVYNLTVNNSSNVTLSGTLNLVYSLSASSGRLDAASNSSTIAFAGGSAQSIPLNTFLNDQVYNLTVNNAAGVTLSGSLSILNALTTPSGKLDASTNSPTLIFAGTSSQSIPSGAFLDDKVYNLTVNNSNNLAVSGTLNLLNTLTTTSGVLDANTNSPTLLIYGGSVAQTISGGQLAGGKVYNLTIDNTAGVTLTSDLTIDNALTINSLTRFTVSAAKRLTVTGNLTNSAGNAGFVFKSDATGDGKLISGFSVRGTVELFLTGGTGASGPIYHYFVPPVSSMGIDNSSVSAAAVSLGLSPTNFVGDLLAYSESDAGPNKDLGWQYFDGYVPDGYTYSSVPFSTISGTKGYNIRLRGDDKITFTGFLNAPSRTFPSLSYTSLGWNLVGNPYPCNYDLTGIPELMNSDDVDNTIYFNRNGGYAVWNVGLNTGTSGYSGIMPPMQGFFVHVIAAGSDLTIPAASKSSSAAQPQRSKGADASDSKTAIKLKKIKLVLNNGPIPDETIVCLLENATTGFDGDYDAYKLFGGTTTTPFIYTELNAIKYAINSVQESETGPVIIPVTVVIKSQGEYKIDITEFENLENLRVVLKHGDVMTNLSKNSSYSFSSDAGTFKDFQLIIGNTITNSETLVKSPLKTWYSKTFLYINYPTETTSANGRIVIYNMQGKPVYSNNLINIAPGETVQLPLNLPEGVYITRITGINEPFVSKIVVY
jgi:hypothetical protein